MAEIIKQLKTRVALRTGDYAYWTTGAGKDIELYKGEVCICTIEPKGHPYDADGKETGAAHTAPTVLFKVADANGKKFGQLDWCSAKAADVYDWAKKSQDEFITWVNTVVEHPAAPVITTGNANGTIAVDGVDVAVKGLGSAAYTDTTAYATSAENGAKQAADNAQKTIDDYVEAHKNDYTNTQIDNAIAAVDTGVHAVALASGTNNGTVKLTVDGVATDNIAVTGLQDAAYTTVESLNATAKGYADAVEAKIPTEVGVMSVVNADDTIVVGGDGKDVTIKVADNKFDAYGAAAAVLGESNDGAAANTVYGAKAAAAAAQSDATIAKTKIETFLGTITPDGSQDIIDTLTEINNYVGEHGEEFAALSEKVTKIENGTTVVPKASDADTLDGKQAADFADATENGAKALAQGVKDVVDANKATWDKAGTAAQAADLAKVATSGSYNDLDNLPTLGALAAKSVITSTDIANEAVGTAQISDKAITPNKLDNGLWDEHEYVANMKEASRNGQKATTIYGGDSVGRSSITIQAGGFVFTDSTGDTIELASLDLANMKAEVGAKQAVSDLADYLGDLASKDNITHELVTDFDDAVKAIKVDDADKLDGHDSDYFATAERVKALEDANHISEITTTANGGLKVTNKNQIDIDTDIIFVLNANF